MTRRRSFVDGFRNRRRAYAEKIRWYCNALRDACRSYSAVRDELDMDHLRVMLGFWLSADSNCVDIGAHRGSVLQMIEERAPHGEHHAFEPIPHLAERLRESFPKATVHEVALTDTRGTVDFTVVDHEENAGYSGISQSLRRLPAKWSSHSITVNTARLDDMLPTDYEPKFIKIDVEGAELGVLRGARDVLRPIPANSLHRARRGPRHGRDPRSADWARVRNPQR